MPSAASYQGKCSAGQRRFSRSSCLSLDLPGHHRDWHEIHGALRACAAAGCARSGDDSASPLDESPGMIRPITLNVVGHVLAQGRAIAPSLDAGALVRHYIEQSVEQPAIREIAPRVLTKLVTEQGMKRPRSEKQLAEETQLRPSELRAVLNGLATAALARPLDQEREAWELFRFSELYDPHPTRYRCTRFT